MLHQKIKGFDKLVTGGNGWRPFSPNGRSWGQVYGQGGGDGVDTGLASPEKGERGGGARRGGDRHRGPRGPPMQGSMSVDLGRRGGSPSPSKLAGAPLSASPNQKIDNLTKKNEVEYGQWEFGGRRALSVEPWEMARGAGGGPMLPVVNVSGLLGRRGGGGSVVAGEGGGGGRQEPKDVSKLIGVASEVFVWFCVCVGGVDEGTMCV